MAGVKITKNELGRIGSGLRPKLSQVVRKTGFDMVAIEQQLSRRDTGQMANGWTFEMTDDLHGVNHNPVEHTIYNEFGTDEIPAQPMQQPAVDQVAPGYHAAIKDVFKP